MKKVFCVVICFAICAAIVCVPVFATSVPETTAAPNVFDTLLDGEAQELSSYSVTFSNCSDIVGVNRWLTAIGAVSSGTAVGDFELHTVSNGWQTHKPIYAEDSGYVKYSSYYVDNVNSGSYSASSTVGYGEALAIGSGATVTPVYVIVPGDGLVQSFAGELFAVGGGLISFVMSNWIVLIPVVAFLVILCIGVIRKTVKGA